VEGWSNEQPHALVRPLRSVDAYWSAATVGQLAACPRGAARNSERQQMAEGV